MWLICIGIYGTINKGKNYFSRSIFDPELLDCIKESRSTDDLGVTACKGPNLKESKRVDPLMIWVLLLAKDPI